jgi:flagellar hook-basal body complex protein FliE
MPLGSIPSTPPIAPSSGAASTSSSASSASGFGDSLTKMIDAVDQSSGAANSAVDQMLDGRGDVHDAMIALQQAELTLQFTVQVRNKLVQAYQDIMRMPV